MAGRTPDEIRASIEANRTALAVSVAKLRGEVRLAGDEDQGGTAFGAGRVCG